MMKYPAITLLLASVTVLATTSQSHPIQNGAGHNNSLEIGEIQELKLEVRALRRDIARLEETLTSARWNTSELRHDHKKWGCFMQDLKAGGLIATGSTQAEAKGLLLERCTQKGGTCFKSDVECSAQ